MSEVPTTTVRIDPALKSAAKPILDELGITLSSGITMFLKALVREQGIPFAVSGVMTKNAGRSVGNNGLNNAGRAKKDEFYTMLPDIEAELEHYVGHFAGKTVLCNCDNPFESNFFKYFTLNFNRLGLRKLVCTCYANSPISSVSLDRPAGGIAYKAVVTTIHDTNGNGFTEMSDIKDLFGSGDNELTALVGDGDFRSRECIELLDEADIVVTNPPFSLFREYVSTLMEHRKDFLIVGNINAVTYKEIFPLFKSDSMWLGASIHSGDRTFYVPDTYEMNAANCGIDEDGRRYIRVKGVRWFTNLDYSQRHTGMHLKKKFDRNDYPKYENYDAIEISRTNNIPYDYHGLMGVPITFIDKYNPDEFEIVMLANGNARTNVDIQTLSEVGYQRHPEDRGGVGIVNGKRTYARIIIRKRG